MGIKNREELLHSFQGQKLSIPNLLNFLPGWRCDIHSEVDLLREEFNIWLDSLNFPPRVKAAGRACDVCLLVGILHPEAPRCRLLLLAKHMVAWAIWDDEIDGGGQLADDTESSLKSCKQFQQCIDDTLGQIQCFTPPESIRESVRIYYMIYAEIRAGIGDETRRAQHEAMSTYIRGCSQKAICKTGQIREPHEYLEIRRDNAALIPAATLNEFAVRFEVPRKIREHPTVQIISKECASLCGLANDMISLKVELRAAQLENIVVSFAFHQKLDLQQSVNKTCTLFQDCYSRITEAESRLPGSAEDTEFHTSAQKYVQALKDVVVGTIYWGYQCPRYLKKDEMDETLTAHIII